MPDVIIAGLILEFLDLNISLLKEHVQIESFYFPAATPKFLYFYILCATPYFDIAVFLFRLVNICTLALGLGTTHVMFLSFRRALHR